MNMCLEDLTSQWVAAFDSHLKTANGRYFHNRRAYREHAKQVLKKNPRAYYRVPQTLASIPEDDEVNFPERKWKMNAPRR